MTALVILWLAVAATGFVMAHFLPRKMSPQAVKLVIRVVMLLTTFATLGVIAGRMMNSSNSELIRTVSASTTILIASIIYWSFSSQPYNRRECLFILRATSLIALPLFFTSITGIGPDLYHFGFHAWIPMAIAGAAGLYLVGQRLFMVAAWLLAALILRASDFSESSNFWDHLVDLPSALAGIAAWAILLFPKRPKSTQDSPVGPRSESTSG